eukprot:NODE_417_length_8973_cov_0.852941.p6 type:complete len:103 gc:universal NODE_417_length_8973_cov_0.852941:3910-4218(+)
MSCSIKANGLESFFSASLTRTHNVAQLGYKIEFNMNIKIFDSTVTTKVYQKIGDSYITVAESITPIKITGLKTAFHLGNESLDVVGTADESLKVHCTENIAE